MMDRLKLEKEAVLPSFWIEYLLLPEKLDEHLADVASGVAIRPSPVELITTFLEQANNSSRNVVASANAAALAVSAGSTVVPPPRNQEAGPSAGGGVSSQEKVASLLCERAARVAVAAEFSLADVEGSIPLHLQMPLLKALERHDASRSLLHRCDLQRWFIRKILQAYPVGSAMMGGGGAGGVGGAGGAGGGVAGSAVSGGGLGSGASFSRGVTTGSAGWGADDKDGGVRVPSACSVAGSALADALDTAQRILSVSGLSNDLPREEGGAVAFLEWVLAEQESEVDACLGGGGRENGGGGEGGGEGGETIFEEDVEVDEAECRQGWEEEGGSSGGEKDEEVGEDVRRKLQKVENGARMMRRFRRDSGGGWRGRHLKRRETLGPRYLFEVMLDVGEIHFMRGRVKRALQCFTRAAKVLRTKMEEENRDGRIGAKDEEAPDASANARGRGKGKRNEMSTGSWDGKDRLGGFIIACRMLMKGGSVGVGMGVGDLCCYEQGQGSGPSRMEQEGRERETWSLEALLSTLGALDESREAVVRCEDERLMLHLCQERKRMGGRKDDGEGTSWEGILAAFREDLIGDHPPYLSWGYRDSLESDNQLPLALLLQIGAFNMVKEAMDGTVMEAFQKRGSRFREDKKGIEFLMGLLGEALEITKASARRRAREKRRKTNREAGMGKEEGDIGIGVKAAFPLGNRKRRREELEEGRDVQAGVKCVDKMLNEEEEEEEEEEKEEEKKKKRERLKELAMIMCCSFDKCFCWELAVRHGLILQERASKLAGYPINPREEVNVDNNNRDKKAEREMDETARLPLMEEPLGNRVEDSQRLSSGGGVSQWEEKHAKASPDDRTPFLPEGRENWRLFPASGEGGKEGTSLPPKSISTYALHIRQGQGSSGITSVEWEESKQLRQQQPGQTDTDVEVKWQEEDGHVEEQSVARNVEIQIGKKENVNMECSEVFGYGSQPLLKLHSWDHQVRLLYDLLHADEVSEIYQLLKDAKGLGILGGLEPNLLLSTRLMAPGIMRQNVEVIKRSCSTQVAEDDDEEISRLDRIDGGNRGNGPTNHVELLPFLEFDIATILHQRGRVLERCGWLEQAEKLYDTALLVWPDDICSQTKAWMMGRLRMGSVGVEDINRVSGVRVEEDSLQKEKVIGIPVSGLPRCDCMEEIILRLVDAEKWRELSDICEWAMRRLDDSVDGGVCFSLPNTDPRKHATFVKQGGGDAHRPGWRLYMQMLRVGRILSSLMPLCLSLQAAAQRNQFNEEGKRLSTLTWQRFEDFMCILAGGVGDGDDDGLPPSPRPMLPAPPFPGAAAVPVISKIGNVCVLQSLACLTAGWLHRCYVAGLSKLPQAVDRYGFLANVTANPLLPSQGISVPGTGLGAALGGGGGGGVGTTGTGAMAVPSGTVYRKPPPVAPRVIPEFGRAVFKLLLEGLVGRRGAVKEDRERGHRWLQGLADLAHESEAYVEALQLYLQAGAIPSSYYCDRKRIREVFTPWVVRKMIDACRAIGAAVQAAVLCQCLPVADHEKAFGALQESSIIGDRDAAAYFECLWEVPVLELLVHMHAKSGDEARVNTLVSLIQQPSLNVNNPLTVRSAHKAALEQKFLQRFSAELLGGHVEQGFLGP